MEQYSYKSSAFRINISRQDRNNAWDVVVDNRLNGAGVQLKKMGKELGLEEVKFFSVRLILPLIWNDASEHAAISQFLTLNAFEKIEMSASHFTQVFVVDETRGYTQGIINAHRFFAKLLVQDALGRQYRPYIFDIAEGRRGLTLEKAFHELLGVFREDSDRKDSQINLEDIEGLCRICHPWEFNPKVKDELNSQINAYYNSSNYAHRKLASFSQYYLNGPLLQTLRLRQSFDSLNLPQYRNVSELIEDAIARREGFSFIRIGEGEGAFASYRRYMEDKSRRNELFGVIGKDIYSIWFKKNIAELALDEYAGLRCAYSNAIRTADYLGIPSEARIVYEYSQLEQDLVRYGYSRGYVGVREVMLDAYDLLKMESKRPTVIGDCDVARAMYNWQDAQSSLEVILPKVLYGLDRLHIISCHPQLAAALRSFLCIDEVNSILIPPEKGRLSASNMAEGDHLEDHFRAISRKCASMQGQVVLVAAGFLGKIYCSLIKEAGGVAIDIGSLADYWAGYSTRAKTVTRTISPFCL